MGWRNRTNRNLIAKELVNRSDRAQRWGAFAVVSLISTLSLAVGNFTGWNTYNSNQPKNPDQPQPVDVIASAPTLNAHIEVLEENLEAPRIGGSSTMTMDQINTAAKQLGWSTDIDQNAIASANETDSIKTSPVEQAPSGYIGDIAFTMPSSATPSEINMAEFSMLVLGSGRTG